MFQNITEIVLLIFPNGEEWHYITVKNLPALLRGITSKEHDEFYCLNCFHSFATGKKHESHKIKIFLMFYCLPKTPKH